MADPINWFRLLSHLLDELHTYEDDVTEAERNAVHLYTAIWQRMNPQENE